MAALAQVPAVIAAGQGAPVDRNGQIQADGRAIIQQQQLRIRALEQQVLQGQMNEQQGAQRYEDRLFAMSQEKQALANQLAASRQQMAALTVLFEQRQAEVQELQRRQAQDAAQIAASLRETAAVSAQLNQERERGQLLTRQIEGLTNRIEQQGAQIQQLEQMHRQTLAAIQKKTPEESSLLASLGSWVFKAIENGLQGFPSSAFTPKDY